MWAFHRAVYLAISPDSPALLSLVQDNDGATAAQMAAAGGHVEVVARLLDAGNSRGDKGLTALHLAAQAGSQPLVAALLALPALDVNATDTDGMTALHWAASKGARCSASGAAQAEATLRGKDEVPNMGLMCCNAVLRRRQVIDQSPVCRRLPAMLHTQRSS